MPKLTEIPNVRQHRGEPPRRWFTSDDLDLVVWLDDSRQPIAFELCYGKLAAEHALSWSPGQGFSHMAVDDGDTISGLNYKESPILVADGHFNAHELLAQFEQASEELPEPIAVFVRRKLSEHPSYVAEEGA